MGNQPTRHFWQIHLSTAVVLMFVAGPMLAMNVQERKGRFVAAGGGATPYEDVSENPKTRRQVWTHYQGWPLPYWEQYFADEKSYGSYPIIFGVTGTILLNVLFITGVLAVTAFGCEFIIRRRESRP